MEYSNTMCSCPGHAVNLTPRGKSWQKMWLPWTSAVLSKFLLLLPVLPVSCKPLHALLLFLLLPKALPCFPSVCMFCWNGHSYHQAMKLSCVIWVDNKHNMTMIDIVDNAKAYMQPSLQNQQGWRNPCLYCQYYIILYENVMRSLVRGNGQVGEKQQDHMLAGFCFPLRHQICWQGTSPNFNTKAPS